MNYQRIYAAFIADRRRTEDTSRLLDDYTEKHHVTPRHLGGDDSPENLIRLTPEDHFFAHLLLAKIHGGRMWAPIAFMVGGSRKDYRPTHSRKAHGWASRAMAKARRGRNAPQFDWVLHRVVNAAGKEKQVRQSEMIEALGLSKSLANMLIKGHVSVAKGWSIVGRERKTSVGDKHHMHRPDVREFRHVAGRVFVGTQFDFSEKCGVPRPAASNLVTGKAGTAKGWYLAERGTPTDARAKAKWQKYL